MCVRLTIFKRGRVLMGLIRPIGLIGPIRPNGLMGLCGIDGANGGVLIKGVSSFFVEK